MQEIYLNVHDDFTQQDVFDVAKEFMAERILNDLKTRDIICYNFSFKFQLIAKKQDNKITADLIKKG